MARVRTSTRRWLLLANRNSRAALVDRGHDSLEAKYYCPQPLLPLTSKVSAMVRGERSGHRDRSAKSTGQTSCSQQLKQPGPAGSAQLPAPPSPPGEPPSRRAFAHDAPAGAARAPEHGNSVLFGSTPHRLSASPGSTISGRCQSGLEGSKSLARP